MLLSFPVVLFLNPSPSVIVIEGETAEIRCGPLGPAEITIQVNGVETALSFQDSNMERIFTFGPVIRAQQGTVFQCFSGAVSTNTATLEVFCKQTTPYSRIS